MFAELQQRTLESIIDTISNAGRLLPHLILGLALFIVGLIITSLISRMTGTILRKLQFDEMLKKAGISDTFKKIGLSASPTVLLQTGIKWILWLVVAQITVGALNLDVLQNALNSVFTYLPNIFAAGVVLLAGAIAAQTVQKAVTAAGKNTGLDFASSLGSVANALILFVAFLMATKQLQFETEIIQLITGCLLAAFALAFGLSFGLGTKEMTRNILAGFYARKLLSPGDRVLIGNIEGVLASIAPTQTVVESEDKRLIFANTIFLDQVVTQLPDK